MEDTKPGEHWIDLSAHERSDIDADIALSRGDLAIAVVILEIEAAARTNQLDAGIERCLADEGEHDAPHLGGPARHFAERVGLIDDQHGALDVGEMLSDHHRLIRGAYGLRADPFERAYGSVRDHGDSVLQRPLVTPA